MKLKLKKEIKWIAPYLDAVSDLVPLEKLKEIKLSRYRATFPSYHGLIETKDYKAYKITVRVYETPKIPTSPLDQETILSHLAHELAHLVQWNDYTIERFVLETQIYLKFGQVLKKIGYEKERNKIK